MSTKTLLIVAIAVVAFLIFRQTGAATASSSSGAAVPTGATSTTPGATATFQPGTTSQSTAAYALAQQGLNLAFPFSADVDY